MALGFMLISFGVFLLVNFYWIDGELNAMKEIIAVRSLRTKRRLEKFQRRLAYNGQLERLLPDM